MPEREYRRLTRTRSRTFIGVVSSPRTSLWLGKDHLLQIDTSGYTESYKRFYFRDIQALVLCKTDLWLYQGVAFAGLASLFTLIAIIGGGPEMAWVFGILAGLFGLVLLFHLLRGPTSKAYLRTAVQTETLASLNRLRRAKKVFEILRPLIAVAQGELQHTTPTAAAPEQPSPPVISTAPAPSPETISEAAVPPAGQSP